jgi:hypothetical protein
VTKATLRLKVWRKPTTLDGSSNFLLGQLALLACQVNGELQGVVASPRSYVCLDLVPTQSLSGRHAMVAVGQQEMAVDVEDGDRWGFVEVVQVVGHTISTHVRRAPVDRSLYQIGERHLSHGHDHIVPRGPGSSRPSVAHRPPCLP